MSDKKTIAALTVRIAADATKFMSGIEKAQKKMARFSRKMERMGKSLSTNLTAPIVGAGVGLLAVTNKAADFADKIDKTAIRTGLARDTLQELTYVADQAGVPFESLESSTMRLNKSMGDAASGSKRQADAFKALGISIYDSEGNMRKMSDMFPEVIQKLKEIPNETQRNSIAMELMGRTATSVIAPLAALGDNGIEKMSQKARDLGLVMSNEGVAGLVNYKDNLSTLQQQFSAVGREMATGFAVIMQDTLIPLIREHLLPAVRGIVTWFRNLTPAARNTGLAIAGLVAAIGPVTFIIAKVIGLVTMLIGAVSRLSKVSAALSAIWSPITLIVIGIVAAVSALILVGKSMYDAWESLGDFFDRLWAQIKQVFAKSIYALLQNVEKFTSIFGLKFEGARNALAGFVDATQKQLDAKPFKSFGEVVSEVGTNIATNFTKAKNAVSDFFSSSNGQMSSGGPSMGSGINFKKDTDYVQAANSGQSGLENNTPEIDLAPMKAQMEWIRSVKQELTTTAIDIQGSFQQLTSGVADAFGQTFEAMGKGEAGIGDLFDNILMAVVSFGQMFAKQLIAAGVAALHFKALLANPIAAIAAGAALLAATSLVKGTLSKGPGGSSGGGGGSAGGDYGNRGLSGDYVAKGAMNIPERIELVAKGSDLGAVIELNNQINRR